MKNLKYILIMIFSMFFLISCGGGETSEGKSGDSQIRVVIVNCNGIGPVDAVDDCAAGVDHHTCIESGDTLVQSDSITTIEIVEVNNNKKVCVTSGSAYILR